MNTYMVKMTTGGYEEVGADRVAFEGGVLAFYSDDEGLILAYSPNSWVEVLVS